MKHAYYPPQFNELQFHCPHCHVFASQVWEDLQWDRYGKRIPTPIRSSTCVHCNQPSYWLEARLVSPAESPVEPADTELPADCLTDYNEARDIVAQSPRGATALLRLVLQKLMVHLGESGKHINDDIKALVAKGLPVVVQQALDVCRVVGNNAVHPGELDVNDTPETAHQLFRMINFIVNDRIARPKQIQALYARLPQGAKDAIVKRDNNP